MRWSFGFARTIRLRGCSSCSLVSLVVFACVGVIASTVFDRRTVGDGGVEVAGVSGGVIVGVSVGVSVGVLAGVFVGVRDGVREEVGDKV